MRATTAAADAATATKWRAGCKSSRTLSSHRRPTADAPLAARSILLLELEFANSIAFPPAVE